MSGKRVHAPAGAGMVARTATTTANASAIFVSMVVFAASLVRAIFCSPMRHRPQAAASILRRQSLRADGDPRLPDICCAKVYVACRSVGGEASMVRRYHRPVMARAYLVMVVNRVSLPG